MGAFAGTYLFPTCSLVGHSGCGGGGRGVAVIGMMVTYAFLPEPKGKSLEQLEREAFDPTAALTPPL